MSIENQTPRVLVADDDPSIRQLVCTIVKRERIEVDCVADGQEAIDYVQGVGKFADRAKFPFPSLVLLDVKLPYVTGLEVLRLIRQECRRLLPVIMLSASAQEADIVTAYRLGANAFLCKPSEARKFEEMVKAIKDFWLTCNTLPEESSSDAPFFEEVLTRGHSSTGALTGHI